MDWGKTCSERLEASVMSSQSHKKIVYVLQKYMIFASWMFKRMY